MEETAKETGVTVPQVKEVGDSMFRFVAQIMSEGDRETLQFGEIRLMRWGIFKVKEGRKKHFEKINNEKSNSDRKQRSSDSS
jgi:hypothetical protein